MAHAYDASTVEMDGTGVESLQQQLLDKKSENNVENKPTPSRATQPEKDDYSSTKKYVFKRGDETFELDDDFEMEFTADKKPTKLSLRELKDRAAGDIAVKNRMHSLAEEKKRVQSTFKEFASLAKKDPLGALEYISNKAKESDSDFEYSKYIEKLAEQIPAAVFGHHIGADSSYVSHSDSPQYDMLACYTIQFSIVSWQRHQHSQDHDREYDQDQADREHNQLDVADLR